MEDIYIVNAFGEVDRLTRPIDRKTERDLKMAGNWYKNKLEAINASMRVRKAYKNET